ncbi:hypothetical protein MBOE_30820 [Mycolicibacterium boenickei]|uniref:Uncharacterized protein n=1 Tax=Mycolicibacterium boenickei TaxID=146017 RepID=A0ABM7IX48_9MYCO|nr:hypothetical protein MBOE_30820 [Mycolicibacterium boenickei]
MIREVVADALDTAVIRDDSATVTVDQTAHEVFRCFLDEDLLPRLERDAAMVFSAGPVLGEQARPVFGVERNLDA